jgi:hypothetical protein
VSKFFLRVYEIFNALLQVSSAEFRVMDADGRYCVQAWVDEEKKAFILRFEKQ